MVKKEKRRGSSKLPEINHGGERIEALLRIPIAIISGLIIGLWWNLTCILIMINWFMTLLSGERNKSLALFCEYFNTEVYKFIRYLTFMSNRRPFPFSKIEWISRFE